MQICVQQALSRGADKAMNRGRVHKIRRGGAEALQSSERGWAGAFKLYVQTELVLALVGTDREVISKTGELLCSSVKQSSHYTFTGS